MKILVVGNGFDLAHGLPTSYWDCLNFLRAAHIVRRGNPLANLYSQIFRSTLDLELNLHNFSNRQIYFLKSYSYLITHPHRNISSSADRDLITLLDKCISNNLWIDFFLAAQENQQIQGCNWIDFEAEMSHCIKKIDFRLNEISQSQTPMLTLSNNFFDTMDMKRFPHLSVLGKLIYSFLLRKVSHEASAQEIKLNIIDLLYGDLAKFTTAMEIFFSTCVPRNKMVFQWLKYPEHGSPGVDKVISFNYTDTFKYYMNKPSSENICHIHGKIRQSILDLDSPLVLGIDEYLDDEVRDKNVDWVMFKKYFQRIYKHSDYKYKGWDVFSSDCHKSINSSTELFIVGHSLDVTDKDVLSDLILNGKQNKTIIFYRNNKQYASQIKNLIRLIGSDELNKRSQCIPPLISFAKQE